MSVARMTPVWSAQSMRTTQKPGLSWLVSARPDGAAMSNDLLLLRIDRGHRGPVCKNAVYELRGSGCAARCDHPDLFGAADRIPGACGYLESVIRIDTRLRNEASDDMRSKLVVGGFTSHPVHAGGKFACLQELHVFPDAPPALRVAGTRSAVKANWPCRLWRI
jgi:hypothetical protein